MTTLTMAGLRAEFERRGFTPVAQPLMAPIGNSTGIFADDGNGCALIIIRPRNAHDRFLRIPWAVFDAARAPDDR